mgnify:CR=1 FL=1
MRVRGYSSVTEEFFQVDVPAEIEPRIDAIVASGVTVYGPTYSRPCVETLRDLRGMFEFHPELAEQRLAYCEAIAAKVAA